MSENTEHYDEPKVRDHKTAPSYRPFVGKIYPFKGRGRAPDMNKAYADMLQTNPTSRAGWGSVAGYLGQAMATGHPIELESKSLRAWMFIVYAASLADDFKCTLPIGLVARRAKTSNGVLRGKILPELVARGLVRVFVGEGFGEEVTIIKPTVPESVSESITPPKTNRASTAKGPIDLSRLTDFQGE